ncbi:methyl-accepting chemotaxis protein [Paenibacillus pinistramenti]|uniref:methyl-accepting chemotaxis protein n=1 Tax=Paenibacillus pinistramenti TaxID=1768003 RepID=UPI001109D1CC|nr:methyl-accepting chemotaxis protein [Paenibacillus pinistramenti]
MQLSKLDEILWKRNKLITWVFWIIAVLGCFLALKSSSMWISNAAALLFSIWLTYANAKKKCIRLIPWLVVGLMSLISIYFSLDSINISISLLFISILLFYPSFRYFSAGFGVTLIYVIIQIAFGVPVASLAETGGYLDVIVILAVTGGVLAAVSYLNQKMFKESEQRRSEIDDSSKRMEFLLGRIKEAAESLASYTDVIRGKVQVTGTITSEVTTAFTEVAKGVEFQAGSISEISETLSVSDQHIRDVAVNSKEMKRLSERTAHVSEEGSEHIRQLSEQMVRVYDLMKSTSAEMEKFKRQNEEMAHILNVISEIAQQTNLLALNAAIEAARAGEQGRGFAVVSGEVRKLAETSDESTKQISDILSKLQAQTESLTVQFGQGTEALEQGKETAVHALNIFNDIRQDTRRVLSQAVEVEASSSSIQTFSSQVVNEVTEISSITEESSAAAQQIMASMEEQRSITDDMVNGFGELEKLIEALSELVKDKQ